LECEQVIPSSINRRNIYPYAETDADSSNNSLRTGSFPPPFQDSKAVLLDRQRWEEINSHFGTKAELMGKDPMNLSRGQDFLSLTNGLFTRESLL
jgi:hypothetical protein